MLEAEPTPGAKCDRRDFISMKNPLTPAGIETATFRFVAQHLNRCVTVVPHIAVCRYGKFIALVICGRKCNSDPGYVCVCVCVCVCLRAVCWSGVKTKVKKVLCSNFLVRIANVKPSVTRIFLSFFINLCRKCLHDCQIDEDKELELLRATRHDP